MREKQRANNLETEKQAEKASCTPEMIAEQLSSQKTASKKNKTVQRMQLLELAMNWDCIDVAKEMILESSLDNILV